MAPKLTGARILDKLMESFRLRPRTQRTQSFIDVAATQLPTYLPTLPLIRHHIKFPLLNPHDRELASTKVEKVFAKGKSFKKDMAILSIAYTLQENPEFKRLVQLIVVIRDNDSEGQVMSTIYNAYRSPTVLSFSLPKFSKPALGSAFSLHLLPMPSVQKPNRR